MKTIRLPGQFLGDKPKKQATEYKYLDILRHRAYEQPSGYSLRQGRHGQKATFVYKGGLDTTPMVFVRHDAPGGILQAPYDGPYKVLQRNEKTFKLKIRSKAVNVSKDWIKPAYLWENTEENDTQPNKMEVLKRRAEGRQSQPSVLVFSKTAYPQPRGFSGG